MAFVTIDPDNFISEYQNVTETLIARGLELSGQTSLLEDNLKLRAAYSYIERKDVEILRRIPNHNIDVTAQYQPIDGLWTTLTYQYNSSRGDLVFNNMTFENDAVSLERFQTFDFNTSYKLPSKPVTFFAGVSNIFNVNYQELFGFQTGGRNLKVGVRVSI